MDVRPSTRAVFEELRAQGNVPSVRKMYAKLKGSYPLLAQELQALRGGGSSRAATVTGRTSPRRGRARRGVTRGDA